MIQKIINKVHSMLGGDICPSYNKPCLEAFEVNLCATMGRCLIHQEEKRRYDLNKTIKENRVKLGFKD